MLLNPDWSTEICDVTIFQWRRAHFKSMTKAQTIQKKKKITHNPECEITRTALTRLHFWMSEIAAVNTLLPQWREMMWQQDRESLHPAKK